MKTTTTIEKKIKKFPALQYLLFQKSPLQIQKETVIQLMSKSEIKALEEMIEKFFSTTKKLTKNQLETIVHNKCNLLNVLDHGVRGGKKDKEKKKMYSQIGGTQFNVMKRILSQSTPLLREGVICVCGGKT